MRKRSLLFLLLFLAACAPLNQIRYTPSRWVRDNDRVPISKPKSREQYRFADIVQYQVFYQMERLVDIPLQFENFFGKMGLNTRQEALNTNNFDEVADSTWFTNRLGRRSMSLEEIRRGPNRGTGPDPAGPWIVLSGKSEGISPGFLIEDSKGDRYLLKFDPPGYLNLATSAEILSTRLFHAFGYNVPENYLVDFKPEILKITPESTRKDKKGKKVLLTQDFLHDLFQRIPQIGGGVYRALASKFIEGELVGPFSFQGKRRGDANDRIPHEHRRELRGYRIFAAFLNHFDARQANSLDTFLQSGTDQKGYLLHYLIDFGSTLGSSAIRPKTKEHLYDYAFNYGQTAGSLLSLGGYYPRWEEAEDSNLLSVAIFDSKTFRPKKWKPLYPNPAFQFMTSRDAFWATKVLMQLRDEQIAAVVKEGRYLDPKAEAYLIKTLIARRDKIGDYYFDKMNPLDNFQLQTEGGATSLSFEDLAIRSGLQEKDSRIYRYRIIQAQGQYDLLSWSESPQTRLSLPDAVIQRMKPGKTYLVQLQSKKKTEEFWSPTIELMIRKDDSVQLLGLFRRYEN